MVSKPGILSSVNDAKTLTSPDLINPTTPEISPVIAAVNPPTVCAIASASPSTPIYLTFLISL